MNIHSKPYRGATAEWQTPPDILKCLGLFDDDPARPGEIDGFFRPWRGFVWLNSPYGPEIGDWLERMADHGNGLAIMFARTETRWFRRWVWDHASALLFLYNRPKFWKNGQAARGNCGGPLVLAAYGPEAVDRLERCGIPGAFIKGWRR